MNFTNSFEQLGADYHSKQAPQGLPDAQLISYSKPCAQHFGLIKLIGDLDRLAAITAGNTVLDGMQPLASVYSGHQFGSYNPQLGDGRALLLGEANTSTARVELQLKGSGVTPYSRFGDGRAVLRSSIREYLASEAMAALGIPTTRALSIVHSSEIVYRETPEPTASVLRLAPSFLRFGHFEYFCHTDRPTHVKKLADYVIATQRPALAQHDTPYLALLQDIVERTACLIAHWQSVGFAHGVLNTDNMSILGLTIDYGPFAFLDDYAPDFICNHSDHSGRYAFNQQPFIGLWNLNALGYTFKDMLSKAQITTCLEQYEPILVAKYAELMRAKLGLSLPRDNDNALLNSLLDLMAKEHTDYTLCFRSLAAALVDADRFIDQFVDRDAALHWLTQYRKRILIEERDISEIQQRMNRCNPKYILRNYLAQIAIDKAQRGDYTELNRLLQVLHKPFDEQADFAAYAKPPPDWGKKLEISCSS